MASQASCEQMEGRACVAPSVPNHGEHTVSRRKRSGSAEGPEQRCQGVSPQHFSIPALSSPQDGRTEGRAVGGAGEGSRAHSPATLRCPCHPRKQRAASRLSCAASRDDAKTARGQGRLSASRALHPDTHPCLSSLLHLWVPSTLEHRVLGPIPQSLEPNSPRTPTATRSHQ